MGSVVYGKQFVSGVCRYWTSPLTWGLYPNTAVVASIKCAVKAHTPKWDAKLYRPAGNLQNNVDIRDRTHDRYLYDDSFSTSAPKVGGAGQQTQPTKIKPLVSSAIGNGYVSIAEDKTQDSQRRQAKAISVRFHGMVEWIIAILSRGLRVSNLT